MKCWTYLRVLVMVSQLITLPYCSLQEPFAVLCPPPANLKSDAKQGRPEYNDFVTFTDQDLLSSGDYHWPDSPSYEDHEFTLAGSKRQRGGDVSPTAPASRSSFRFPSSLTRKLTSSKDRKGQRSCSSPDSAHESIASRSRASSLRSPSLLDTRTDSLERRDIQMPITPNQSFVAESHDDAHGSVDDVSDLPYANEDEDEDEAPEALARTPLLPPVMAMLRTTDEPVQSPLQSPKIADSPDMPRNPFESPSIYNGLPSPPLSTKPSISSFHHRAIIPSAEIPPIRLAEPQDEWALKLGHANFTIFPEPYLPTCPASVTTCKKLRADWDTARCEFMKHLARTGEHYSTTSKVYQLTEEKWSTLDTAWKRYHEQALTSIIPESQEALELSLASLHEPAPVAKIPSISGPGGKFPKVGDLGIVGPMQQAKPVVPPQRPSRKRAFWKFLQGVLPSSVAFGRTQA